jgi:DNA-binding XRE family transcriptional regulator
MKIKKLHDTFQYEGKLWVLAKATEKELKFEIAQFAERGIGNYLKQWRHRHRNKKKKIMTQAAAAKKFKVTQSTIAKIERNQRPMPKKMFKRIHKDNLDHGTDKIFIK